MQRSISDIGMLAGRVALAAFFIQAGFHKLSDWPSIIHLFTHVDTPMPTLAGAIEVVFELVGGGLIGLGLRTRVAALALILFTIVTDWPAHRFWLMHGRAASVTEHQFFFALAVSGGLMMLASCGPGRYSSDRR